MSHPLSDVAPQPMPAPLGAEPPEPKKEKKKRKPLIPRPVKRVLGWIFKAVTLGILVLAIAVCVDGWEAFGQRPVGARLVRMQASHQWADGVFENPDPLNNFMGMYIKSLLFGPTAQTVPEGDIPVVDMDPALFDEAPASGLRVSWFGHSTLLFEIEGRRFLTDPVWGETPSPVRWLGPKRWYEPPMAIEELPELDAILISHDHYDHLDHPSIVALISASDAPFIAPLGVGAHLQYWGVPPERIIEVDWWDEQTIEGLRIVCVPSRHASGRQVLDQNQTLWAGYALISDEHRLYFSGDTGLFDGMREIGERLGPFDVTFLEVGAYNQAWPDWHLGPEQAVTAHGWVRGEVLVPIHWGLFNLANHGWTEPVERTVVAAEAADVTVAYPRPGASFELDAVPSEQWWPEVPWQTADEHPIVAHDVTLD